MPNSKKTKAPILNQKGEALSYFGADAADMVGACTSPALLSPGAPTLKDMSAQIKNTLRERPPVHTCKQVLWLSFFFDGTGNNLDADIGTQEHSNVARLFLAHQLESETAGRFAFYVPGVGTYFKDIGDPGTTAGLAFAKFGEARLAWAYEQIDKTLKKFPAANIAGIRIAVFGFSRGATQARAFARQTAARCQQDGAIWRWKDGRFPLSVYFMGLFDTVASVGLPASTSLGSLAAGSALESVLNLRRGDSDNGLIQIAFGAPGADPTPGFIDGHMDWAGNLRIPPLVERCVHMVAAHEVRNSFPSDSVREGVAYSSNVIEMVYPGMHSNVGGGYRPGEGGKSLEKIEMLSLIPLRAMHREARNAGVPLDDIGKFQNPQIEDDYRISPKLVERFTKYMKIAGWGGQPLGKMVLSHMRLYLAWRFRAIHLNLSQKTSAEATKIQEQETQYAQERQQHQARMQQMENDPARLQAQRELNDAQFYLRQARSRQGHTGGSIAREQTTYNAAKQRFDDLNDPFMRENAKLHTLPSIGTLAKHLALYDRHLLKDVEAIKSIQRVLPKSRREPLRPHYAALIEAYDNEFLHHRGLKDADIIAFFDTYIHDSLAGFAQDQTLPSDPRVMYIGGDTKMLYARLNGLEPNETALG